MAKPDFPEGDEDIDVSTEQNPFHDLYVTELCASRPEEFVRLFSPFFINNALLLFEPANVVVKGTQGSGKSMLLNLLTPEVRMAYEKSSEEDFPVPVELRRFVSAGINFTTSGALDISQRPMSDDETEDIRLFPLFFADFLNYWVVHDILTSINQMTRHPEFFSEIKSASNKDAFAEHLCQNDCWFGYLDDVRCFSELQKRLLARIVAYREFHQFNIRNLPTEIQRTKTAIGRPISEAAKSLVESGLLCENVPLFVRIDQHERLCRSDDLRPDLGTEYRRIINKALSTRDPRVFYRLGTRRYAWTDDLLVYGTQSSLEWERDYKLIDLDDLLRRQENRRIKWIFPGFAQDVFARRLRYSGLTLETDQSSFQTVVQMSPEPAALAKKYVGSIPPERALQIEAAWPEIWKDYLKSLYAEDPLEAKLAEAWALQQGSRKTARMDEPPPVRNLPWRKRTWRKERIKQALLQLAGSCGQRPLWWGDKHILALSSGSILVFVSLCQHIWDTFLRFERGKPAGERSHPVKNGIGSDVQAIAIQTASSRWYEKIANEECMGNDRQRFVENVGRRLQKRLYEDKAMSYPGHNGFSLTLSELRSIGEVRRFLDDAVDFGDLYEAPHTTKSGDRRPRMKWYLHPILSPHFRIHESHTKEPVYVAIQEVMAWMKESGIVVQRGERYPGFRKQEPSEEQFSLFPEVTPE